MKISLTTFMIFTALITFQAKANTVRIGASASLFSDKLVGVSKTTSEEDKLVSNTNFHYGLNFRYALSQSFHMVLNYTNKSIDFDNTQEIIAGEEAFVLTQVEAGVRWIIHPRVAFRILFNADEELAFTVNEDNQAEVFSENLNYLSVYYDQVVFLGGSMFSGFKVGYDLPASGDQITNRTAVKYGVFAVLNSFEIHYEIRNKTKETDTLEFTDDESVLNFTYTFRF